MKMLHPHPPHDLTYSDVFMVPSLSAVGSRFGVDLTTPDKIGTTIPLVVANMTAIAGRRMSEVVARRGGVAVLPQDIPVEVIDSVIGWVKTRHPLFETPITLSPTNTVGDALSLIHKRAHGAVIIIDSHGRPIGVFTEHDAVGFDRFTQLHNVMSSTVHILAPDVDAATAHEQLGQRRLHVAPVVDEDERLVGMVTQQDIFFATVTLDRQGNGSADGEPSPELKVRDIMTSPAVSADEDTEVLSLCKMLTRLRIHRVPIVQDGKISGIISSLDICAALERGEFNR